MKIPIKSRRQSTSEKATRLTVRIQYLTLTVSVMLILFVLTGCATMPSDVKLPPVAETSGAEIQEGRFVWIDLLTEDVVAAASFYSRLFGWRAAQSRENGEYYLFTLDGKPVAGMTAMESKDATASESLWLATISVSDVDQGLAAAKAHGGQVLEGPLDAVGRGRMVLVSDAGDAPVVLLAAGGRGPTGWDFPPVGRWSICT